MILKNVKFLTSRAGKTVASFAAEINISEASIYYWGKGKVPTSNTLKRIANYFSETLDIPIGIFEDGKALLTKDFSKMFPAQILPKVKKDHAVRSSDISYQAGNETLDLQSVATQELSFIASLRKQAGSTQIPLDPSALQTLLEMSSLTGGIGTENQSGFTRALRGLHRSRSDEGDKRRDGPDKKDQEAKKK
jgi:transcriptional regulator with XRE-family HTH domain